MRQINAVSFDILQLADERSVDASANTKAVSDHVNPTPVAKPTKATAVSSVAAGTVLKGIGYHANKPEPVAMPDEEYPAWLWKLLDASTPPADASQHKGSGFVAKVVTKAGIQNIDKRQLRQKNRTDIRVSITCLASAKRKLNAIVTVCKLHEEPIIYLTQKGVAAG